MYGLGLFLVYGQIKMLLHDLSWIPIFVQSFISISYLVFEIRLLKLNDNNNNNQKKNFESWLLKNKLSTDYAV